MSRGGNVRIPVSKYIMCVSLCQLHFETKYLYSDKLSKTVWLVLDIISSNVLSFDK